MADQKKENTTSEKAENFITKNAKLLIILLIVIICGVVCYLLGTYIGGKSKAKKLSEIDNIQYELTNESAALDATELETRRNDALNKLAPYAKKGGIVGARANMLCAELSYEQGDFGGSAEYWEATANKAKKAYTAPIAYFNLGACYEQLGKIDEACDAYKKASDDENFTLRAHASYSYGRCLEAKGDFKAAVEAYTALNDRTPDDTWAKLAKTRILMLQIEGKTE